jgi:ATP/ADP translocase
MQLPASSRRLAALRDTHPVPLLLAISVLASLAGLLIEFQFYTVVTASDLSVSGGARFFASLYLTVHGTALLVQVLSVTLQRRLGLAGGLLILPAVLATMAPAALAGMATSVRTAMRVAEGGLKSSIHRVCWEQTYLVLPPDRRAMAKLLVDGTAARVAEGSVAVLIYAWLTLSVGDTPLEPTSGAWMHWTLTAVVVAWVVSTWALRRTWPGGRAQPTSGGASDARIAGCCPIVATLGEDL